ncbi:MAG TPA: FliH/SctL family protein, partial [Polyangiaceae bacterium LLY-WYZ-15_(1-7)]|nr:FliH/SctL family protein [Polyangiaceae bacterium LLY-WYZ-15_(1-7)]
KAKAEAIREAAEGEAERRRAEAEAAGREAGRAATAAALLEAAAVRDRALGDAEEELRRLAVAAAERLVHAELALAPERIRDLVGGLLERARRAGDRRLRVHPEDAPLLDGLPALAGAERIHDPALARGDVILETELGRLDGRLEVRLEALRRALEER